MTKKLKLAQTLEDLKSCIISCRLCQRLVDFRERSPSKKPFLNQAYWRKPVPGFGDPKAWLLITGLAPSAQGGNRTGRIFTGDESGRFLFKALYQEGLANQPLSESIEDNLELKGCYVTAAVKCVPPQNKPTNEEIKNCSIYYWNELYLLKNIKSVLALGRLGFDAFLKCAQSREINTRGIHFEHGKRVFFEGLPTLYGCYHPSPQNTNTGKLTEAMLIEILKQIKSENLKSASA
ncbi:MAG: uracil-DNA glycosylase [Anaerolineae bacterium]